MDWHRRFGIALLALLVFRLIWGVIGSSTARFASFMRPPKRVIAYLRGDDLPGPGHNPLGGYSVAAILLLMCVQVITGLFAVDVDGLESGPLSDRISFDQGREAAAIHHLAFDSLLVLLGLHVLAILFYLVVKHRNLVRPMVTGRDSGLGDGGGGLLPASLPRLGFAVTVAVVLAWWCGAGLPI